MGKFSRDKGARFERELAQMFRDNGIDAERTAQHCGKNGDAPDVKGIPGCHIEAKAQERMSLYNWMEQAILDSDKTGDAPVVIHKQNRKPILCTMLWKDWIDLYKRANK